MSKGSKLLGQGKIPQFLTRTLFPPLALGNEDYSEWEGPSSLFTYPEKNAPRQRAVGNRPALKLAGESLPSAWKNLNYHSTPKPHFPPLILPWAPFADVCLKDEIVNGGASRNKLIQPKVKYHNSEMTTGDCSPDHHEN